MNYFERLEVFECRLGFSPLDSSSRAKKIVLATRCGFVITLISYFVSPAWYCIFEAKTPENQSASLYFALCGLLMLSWYLAIIFQREKYTTFLDKFKLIIEKSK